jgi:hypothetical protein
VHVLPPFSGPETTTHEVGFGPVGDDLIPILTRFHREVVLPDIQRVVGAAVEESERRLRDEIHAGFDALARRIDRWRPSTTCWWPA